MPFSKKKWSSEEPSPREIREMRDRGEWMDEDYDDEPVQKAPLVFRVLAWLSMIAIFFAVGYGATSLAFKWMDSGNRPKHPGNLANTRQDAEELLAKARSEDNLAEREMFVSCTISIPDGTNFVARQVQCNGGLREDTMKQALAAYMDAVKESSMLDPATQNISVFQSGDWLYLNMNKKFHDSLNKLGTDKSKILLTGIVKTMADNFAPVSKVKFYVDGKEVRDKKPVDLSVPWGIGGR